MRTLLALLRPLVMINYRYPFAVLSVSILFAIGAGFYATRLVIDTDLASLLPDHYDSVQALERLRDSVGGETPLEVTINSPDFEANKAFAEALIPRAMELYDPRLDDYFVNRYEYRRDVEVLKDYALYLSTEDEIDQVIDFLEERLEQARLEANPFFIDFEDDFDDEEEEDERLREFEQMYHELIPSEYPVNQDSSSLVISFFPTGAQSDLTYIRDLFRAFGDLIAEMEPASYHPEMVAVAGGRLERHLMELDSIIRDVVTSFGSGITAVILLVGIYFMIKLIINYRRGHYRHRRHSLFDHLIRFPVPIMVIGIPLLISLSITFAIAYFALGTLNTMTSVLFVILFGLGIDYGIHFYARYLEKRSAGDNVRNALLHTYDSTGAAIMTSATTTAVALFVLMIADFRGFSEFGFISGTGIVLAYLSMLFVLPAIIVIFERYRLILINKNLYPTHTKSGEAAPFPFARTIFIAGTFIVALVLFNTDKLYFEYNFGELEPEFPKYEEYRELRGDIDQATGRRNPAYILADTDEEVRLILQTIREKKKANPETTILAVEALQERFPVNQVEEEIKLAKIAEIRELLNDPFMQDVEGEYIDILQRASQVREPLSMEDVPDFLKNRFVTRDGELGRFVMIYPAVGLSDGRNSIAFKNEIGVIETSDGRTYHAASTSIVAAEMLELMRDESPYMVAATFIMIFILVYIGFRSFRWTIIAMLPLLIGLSWTFGAMIILGLSFNMYNLVVLPAILGIGNDNGVHLASRYREEGRKSMSAVLKSTGQHITIGSFTTMLGFAGLLLTNHPGLTSIGVLAVVGIGLTLFSALTYLPALVQLLENKGWIRF